MQLDYDNNASKNRLELEVQEKAFDLRLRADIKKYQKAVAMKIQMLQSLMTPVATFSAK